MHNKIGKIKFSINVPVQGKKKSQLNEYLKFYKEPKVKHIILLENNIIQIIRKL